MKTRFYNAHIVQSVDKTISNGELTVVDGKISYVGPEKKHDGIVFNRQIDCKGDILMAGLVNAHAHSAMTLFRSLAEGMTLSDWLFKRIFPLEKNLTDTDVYNGAMLAIAEYVRNGITMFGDMYCYSYATAEAAEKSGIKITVLGSASDVDGSDYQAKLDQAEKELLKYSKKNSLTDFILGCHAEYVCSEKLLEGLVLLAHKYKKPLQTHLSETLFEVGECTVRHNGLTPVYYLDSLGFFNGGATVAHCVHIDKDEIALLKQNQVNIVTNPSSNLKLASGIAPVYNILKQGINLALGTDGAASNNSLDLFKEMFLTATLQKVNLSDASVIDTKQVLYAATEGGAKALFRKNTGKLETGFDADIIRIKIDTPSMRPNPYQLNHLVYSTNGSAVKMTMVNGKILYEDGQYYLADSIENIYKNVEKSSKRLLSLI